MLGSLLLLLNDFAGTVKGIAEEGVLLTNEEQICNVEAAHSLPFADVGAGGEGVDARL
jgi:hypothetical protein